MMKLRECASAACLVLYPLLLFSYWWLYPAYGLLDAGAVPRAVNGHASATLVANAFAMTGAFLSIPAYLGVRGNHVGSGLTAPAEFHILFAAPIRAEPLETPPQPESRARQRGAYSRIFIVSPLRPPWRAAGGWPVVYPKETRRCRARKISSALF